MLKFEFLEKSLSIFFLLHFVFDFHEKCFSCYILLTDEITLIVFTSWDIGQYVYWIVCFPGCDVINFEINLFNLAICLHDQVVKTKI